MTDKLVPRLRFPEFRGDGEWEVKPLSKLIKALDAGVSVNSGDRPAKKDESGILKTSAVTDGIFIPKENKVVIDLEELNRLKEPVKYNTIIISRMNTPLLVGANAYIEQDHDNLFLPDRLWAAKPKQGTSMRFVAYILGSGKGRAALSELATGTSGSMKNISKTNILGLSIYTPSLKEQQKIADCLASLDDLIAAHTDKLDALKTHKKGLMQQLFPREGETVPRLRFPEFRGAGEWEAKPLKDLCTAKISYGIVQAGPHVPNGMPYIKSTDLNSELCLSNLERTSDVIAKKYRRSEVEPDDLVFSLRGNIGVAKIVPKDIPVANLTQGTARIRTKGPSQFYLQAFQSRPVHDRILAVSKGSTFQEISLDDLRKIELFHPEISEQQKIADCLTALDDLITAQSEKIAALKQHKQGLMQQLFPSNPVDSP